MAAPRSELTVITKAKDLCRYVMTVTEKSPKRFRFTLVSRMQNLAIDIIEKAYRANEVYASGGGEGAAERRRELQREAMTSAKLLGYIALLANEQGCILMKQYEQITRLLSDCQNLLGAWMTSDRRRRENGGATLG
jgi:hypothetical protein